MPLWQATENQQPNVSPAPTARPRASGQSQSRTNAPPQPAACPVRRAAMVTHGSSRSALSFAHKETRLARPSRVPGSDTANSVLSKQETEPPRAPQRGSALPGCGLTIKCLDSVQGTSNSVWSRAQFVLVRPNFKGREMGRDEVDHTRSMPNSCPIPQASVAKIGPFPGCSGRCLNGLGATAGWPR